MATSDNPERKEVERERLASDRSARTAFAAEDSAKDKAAAKLEALQARLDALKVPTAQGGSKGAFLEGEGTQAVGADLPPAIPAPAGMGQKIAEAGVPLATGMYGAYKGQQAVTPLAVGATAVAGPLAGGAVKVAGAVAGAYAGAGGGSLTVDGAKRALNLPGAPDKIDEYFANAATAGSDAAWGEFWGQGLGQGLSKLSPFRRAVDPESAALFEKQAVRLRSAYERLSGTSIRERAWYNPARMISKYANELDDAGVQRLIAQGVDPKAAQQVALTGGIIPSEIEETAFSKMMGIVANSKSVINPDMHVYNQARTKLITEAALEDVGTSMTKMVAPEQVAELIHGTLNGRVDTLTTGRRLSANAVGFNVPTGTRFNMAGVKRSMPAGTAGEDIINGLPDDLPWTTVQEMRMNIGKMAHDELLSDTQRGQAKWLAEQIDNKIIDDLPDFRIKRQYKEFTRHDDAINSEGFNTALVKGLLKENKAGMLAYANKIINKNDVGNYRKLERSLMNAPGGPEILADVRGNISERFLAGSVKEGIIQPSDVILNLGTNAKGQAKYFMGATMGPEYAKNWHQYAKTMDTVNDAARRSGRWLGYGRSVLTVGAGAGVATAAYRQGGVSPTDALYMATAMLAPTVVAKALTSNVQAKILNKVASNVAKGINPKTTSRLAMRLCEYAGYGPEDFFKGQGVLESEKITDMAALRKQMEGNMMPATGGPPTPAM